MTEDCNKCKHGRNCINGRYCQKLKQYVEYSKETNCKGENYET